MPATYTSSLRLTKPAVGDTNWGTTVNSGFTDLTDSAIAGYTTVSMPSNADYTLTSNNGAADEARSMMLNITSAVSLTTTRNVICPSVSKLYSIKNATTGGQSIVLKTSGGTGVTIPNGSTMILACNGTDVVVALDYISFSNLAYTGTLTGGTGVVNLGSGQFYKDASGNVGIGTSSPSTYGKFAIAGTGAVKSWVLSDGPSNTSFRGLAIGIVGSGQQYGGFNMQLDSGELRVEAGYATYGGFTTFWTNGAERARIDSSGNLLVGATSRSGIGVGTDLVAVNGTIGFTSQLNGNSANVDIVNRAASGALRFYTNGGAGPAAAIIDASGNLTVNVGSLGYGTGSGGAVTQATSRTTGVTLNKINGSITLVSAAGTTSWLSFVVNNSTVAATDTVIVNQKSGADKYLISVTGVNAGSFAITFATTGGATTEQPVFNFAVIKAVAS